MVRRARDVGMQRGHLVVVALLLVIVAFFLMPEQDLRPVDWVRQDPGERVSSASHSSWLLVPKRGLPTGLERLRTGEQWLRAESRTLTRALDFGARNGSQW